MITVDTCGFVRHTRARTARACNRGRARSARDGARRELARSVSRSASHSCLDVPRDPADPSLVLAVSTRGEAPHRVRDEVRVEAGILLLDAGRVQQVVLRCSITGLCSPWRSAMCQACAMSAAPTPTCPVERLARRSCRASRTRLSIGRLGIRAMTNTSRRGRAERHDPSMACIRYCGQRVLLVRPSWRPSRTGRDDERGARQPRRGCSPINVSDSPSRRPRRVEEVDAASNAAAMHSRALRAELVAVGDHEPNESSLT